MAEKLTKSQRAVMGRLNKSSKAYVASGNRVEVNGHRVRLFAAGDHDSLVINLATRKKRGGSLLSRLIRGFA